MSSCPASRFHAAVRRVAERIGKADYVPQLLVRFGFPGLMARVGVEPRIPDPAFIKSQQLYHTLLLEQARAVGQALRRAGVPHFFAKGIPLLGRIYHPGDRLVSDIDVYVPPDARDAAVRALRGLAYVALPDDAQAGPAALRSALTLERDASTAIERMTVDLHWGLDPVDRLLPRPDGPVPSSFWESIDDTDLPAPDAEHHAALLVHELVHTDLLHVRAVLDLAYLLRDVPDDGGGAYVRVTRELGVGRFAVLVAHLLSEEFRITRPTVLEAGERGWNRFTRALTLERWLEIVACAPLDRDDAITLERVRRRLRLVDRPSLHRLYADAFFPPGPFLEWRWRARGVRRARLRHYGQVLKKVIAGRA